VQAETIAILLNGTFADGGATVAWPDMSGTVHMFPSVAEFKAFAAAVASFVAAVAKVQNGTLTTLPPATATIA
jgi:predicted NUDIX family NTP pyrophosphohydrolase